MHCVKAMPGTLIYSAWGLNSLSLSSIIYSHFMVVLAVWLSLLFVFVVFLSLLFSVVQTLPFSHAMDWRSHAPRLGTPSRAWQWWHTGEQQSGGGGQVWRLWASVAARQWQARAGQRAHIFPLFFSPQKLFLRSVD